MSDLNLDYEKYGKSKKGTTYDEKLKTFKEGVVSMLMNSTFIGQINEPNLNEMFELLKNKNVLVPHLPIFKYGDRVMCLAKGEINDDYEHGKYKILTVDDIKNYLKKDYLVFVYTVFDTKYVDGDKLKFRTVVLKE